MAKQVMPKAVLESRPSDVVVPDDQLIKISLFAKLKRKPSLDKFPGAYIVRKFQKGEVIFRQGEAGWTALYPLTSEDALLLRLASSAKTARERLELQAEVAELSGRVEQIKLTESMSDIAIDIDLRRVATVHLAVARSTPKSPSGLLGRLRGLVGGRSPFKRKPTYIPIDAQRDVDYETLQAPIYEGETFGEMSCLYRTPRSGTTVAARDCYMLEMMRNIFDQCQKDPAYKAMTDELYRKRILQIHLQKLPLFRDLKPEQFEMLRNKVELVSYEAGQVICDEYERSDCMWIVRNGLVKVLKKASPLLSVTHVRSWDLLFKGLREGEAQPATARGKVFAMLPEAAKKVLRSGTEAGILPGTDRQEVVLGLNEVIKDRAFAEAKEVASIPADAEFAKRASALPPKRKEWTDHEARHFNRLVLETLFAGALRNYRKRVGPQCVLNYCAKGDFLGEMGLMTGLPRSASCLAHGHPQDDGSTKEAGSVELVRVPGPVFQELIRQAPDLRNQLETIVANRRKQIEEASETQVWEEAGSVQNSTQFEKLGLIQGQRLMLIDLDRCTRCDECVRACVDTHTDGNSRLFLDGPRFGKYLVPTTCRSCLDPVCMIGCPVGSIHRGDNGQIVIEDWCIGCGLCAGACPYGSIQMHDIGVIAENARGWRYQLAAKVKDEHWNQPKFRDDSWAIGTAPFHFDREFRETMTAFLKEKRNMATVDRHPLTYFRYEFQLGSDILRPDSQIKLELTSSDPSVVLYVNGKELPSEKPKGNKRELWIPPKEAPPPKAAAKPAAAPAAPAAAAKDAPAAAKPAAAPATPPAPAKPALKATDFLRVGRNVIAVKVMPKTEGDAPMLQLRMDELRRAEGAAEADDVTEKIVTERAVVCDLCSTSFGQVPACVNACPHDAAMRVDARFNFPTR